MNATAKRNGKINVRAVVILGLVAALLGGGLVGAYFVRKRMIASSALAEGRAAFDRQDWPEACKQLRRYLGKYPEDVEVIREYARAHLNVRPLKVTNISSALGAYRRLVRLDPSDVEAYKKLAMLYAGVGDFTELTYIAEKRLDANPKDLDAPIWLAKGLSGLRKPKEAERVLLDFIARLREMKEKHPQYVKACLVLSRILENSDTAEAAVKAKEWLDRAIEYDGDSAVAYVHRAGQYRRNAQGLGLDPREARKRAEADLRRAEGLRSPDPRILLMLAEEWMKLGELDRATQQLENARQVGDDAAKEYFLDLDDWETAKFITAAELSLRRGATAKDARLADAILERLETDQKRVAVLPYAVRLYVDAKELPKARECLDAYEEAVQLGYTNAAVDAKVAVLKGLLAQAENEWFRVIEELGPYENQSSANAALLQMLSRAYAFTGQPGRAVRVLEKYLRLNPTDRAAQERFARQLSVYGEPTRALEAARRAESLGPDNLDTKLLRIEMAAKAQGAVAPTSQANLVSLEKELAALAKAHPGNEDVRLLQGMLAELQGDRTKAARLLEKATNELKEPLQAQLRLAELRFRSGNVDESIELLRSLCERVPEKAVPWKALAGVHRSREDFKKARSVLEKGVAAAKASAGRRDLQRELAVTDLVAGDKKACIARLKELAAEDATDVKTREMLLSLPEVRGDEATARQLVDEIREVEGKGGVRWRFHQASLWLARSDWRKKSQDIVASLGQCVDADPTWTQPVLLLGRVHERLGALDRAEAVYRRSLARRPGAVEVGDRLIALLEKLGRPEDAREVLASMATTEEVRTERQIRLAIESGDLTEAIEGLRVRIAAEPKDTGARVLLARLLYRQAQDTEAAWKELDQAASLDPNDLAVWATRIAILRAEGKEDEAVAVAKKQAEARKDSRAQLLYAVTAAKCGRSEEAEAAYRELLDRAEDGAGHLHLGQFYFDQGKTDKAMATWRQGLKAHPSSSSLRRRLIQALVTGETRKEREEGLAMLAELERNRPDSANLMWLRTLAMLKEGTPESRKQAQTLLRRIVERAPTAEDAHIALVTLAMERGDFAGAREAAVRGLGTNPRSRKLLLARAEAEAKLNNPSVAMSSARAILATDADDSGAMALMMDVAARTGNKEVLEELRSRLTDAVKRNPDNGDYYAALAKTLTLLGDSKKAIEILKRYTSQEPGRKDKVALLTLADLYRNAGDLEEAGKWVDRAAEVAPGDADVVRGRVLLCGERKDYEGLLGLIEEYRKSKRVDPKVLLSAASVLSGSREHARKAMPLVEQAVEIAPAMIEAKNGLAVLAYQLGDVERAKRVCREILEQDPTNVQALNDLAWILAEKDKDYDRALELADRGIALDPRQPNLLDTRGVILAKLPDRLEDARADFAKLVEVAREGSRLHVRGLLWLGRLSQRLGEVAKAKDYLERARKLDRDARVLSGEERNDLDSLLKGLPSG